MIVLVLLKLIFFFLVVLEVWLPVIRVLVVPLVGHLTRVLVAAVGLLAIFLLFTITVILDLMW